MGNLLRGLFLLISLSFAIESANASISVSETHTDVSCHGESTGSIDISTLGGLAPYSYAWADGNSNEDRINISTGLYTVTVTDFLGATATLSVSINEPAALSSSSIITPVTCGGGNDGAIDFSVAGGTPGYTFVWSDGAATEDRGSITAAIYKVTITDAAGCVRIDSANVTQPMGMVPSATVTNASCSGNTGQINLTVQYGYPAYSYVWDDGSTAEDRTSLAIGTYTVTVTDQINCSVTMSATVNQVSGAMSINSSFTNPNCYHGNDGSIHIINVIGSSGPYSYNWSNGGTGANNTGLAAGAYTVTATSFTGCTASKTVNLTDPPLLTLDVNAIPLTCYASNNGAITTSVSGGTSPYSYNWGGGIVSQNRIGLSPGIYSVTVTDNKGCSVSASDTVAQPLQVSVSTSTSPLACSGGPTGSVFTSVSGGTGSYTYWWGSGIISPDRININSGTYSVTVTDGNGCSAVASATIQPYTAMSLSTSQKNVTCYGGQDGAIDLSVSNGLPPYAYAWNPAATTDDLNSIASGTYAVTVTDNHACTAAQSVTITQPSFPIIINATTADVNCSGANDGSISLAVSNGVGPYSFNWSDAVATQNRSNLTGGNFDVTVTDHNGCTTASAYTIHEPSAIQLTAASGDVTCFGGTDGYVHLNVTGGFAPYTYTWNDGGNTQLRDTLPAGTYSVTVTDMHACSVSSTTTISQPTLATLNLSITDVTCDGLSNGAINVSVSDSGSYTYLWDDGNNNQNRSNLSAGNYSVTANDIIGCTVTASGTIQQPAPIQISETHVNEICGGSATGSIQLSVSGGSNAYNFAWSNGANTQNISSLASGNYTVTVSDSNSCTASQSISIQQGSSLTLNETHTDVSCFGGNNATISMAASGGVAPYSFSWNDGNGSSNRTNLNAGSYTVNVSDANSCSATASVVIAAPSAITLSSTHQDATCAGSSTGSIDLTVSGGTGSYLYAWSNASGNEDLANVPAGNYTVNVTDANNCGASTSVIINEPAAVIVNISMVPVSCNGGNNGSLTASATGGNGTYSYSWNNGISSANISQLNAGAYAVTATDSKGCSATASAMVTEPAIISIAETITHVSCQGGANGSLQTLTTGGNGTYTYHWNNGATTQNIAGLSSGSFAVTVTDGNGCSASKAMNVTEPSAIQLTTTTTNAGCSGSNTGSINLSVSGGIPSYQYVWNNGATTQDVSNIPAGNYSVSVIDGNSCVATASVNVNQAPAIQVALSVTDATCFGGANGVISTAVSGGIPLNGNTYFYQWSNAASTQNIGNLTANTYHLTVTDATNCEVTASATIAQPSAIQITETHQNISCNGSSDGNIHITSTGGSGSYTYQWSNSATTQSIQNISANTYTLTITDGNNCSAQKSVTITEPAAIALSETHTAYACAGSGGSINIAASGGTMPYSLLWSDGATTQNRTQLNTGNYSVILTDANHCTATQSINIAALPPINTIISKTDATCNGSPTGEIDLNVSGGIAPYQYTWNTGAGSQDLHQVPAGVYDVLVRDANNCAATNSTTIYQSAAIIISDSTGDVKCYGGNEGTISLSVTGGAAPYSYQWSNTATSQNLSNITAGSYSVTVSDAQHCHKVVSNILVNQPQQFSANALTYPAGCSGTGGAVHLGVSGGTPPYSYLWSTNDSAEFVHDLDAGTYTVTVLDVHGCSLTKSATVSEAQPLMLQAAVHPTSCPEVSNGNIQLTAAGGTPAYSYDWSNGDNTATIEQLAIGIYTVTVNDVHHCSVTASYQVLYDYTLTAQANASQTTTAGQAITLTGQASEDHHNTYSWSPSFGMQCSSCDVTQAIPSSSTTYTFLVKDENGCSATDTVAIEVKAVSSLFVPNAFTPNNDGNNDVLQVYGDMSTVEYFEFQIFNRWGEKVYETNSPRFTWDGSYRGSPSENGVYIYLMKTVFIDGSKSDYKGSITLIR